MPAKSSFAGKKPLTQRYFIAETAFGDSLLTELNALLKTDAKVISSEGLTEAEAEKSIKPVPSAAEGKQISPLCSLRSLRSK